MERQTIMFTHWTTQVSKIVVFCWNNDRYKLDFHGELVVSLYNQRANDTWEFIGDFSEYDKDGLFPAIAETIIKPHYDNWFENLADLIHDFPREAIQEIIDLPVAFSDYRQHMIDQVISGLTEHCTFDV